MWSSIVSTILIINEFMASNAGVAMSPATNFDSWIEIYNPTEEIVDMGGMHLSYDENNLTMWQMPNTMGKVPAKGFKVIWLGSRDVIWTNAPFKLTCDGGSIYLSDKSGNLITSESYPAAKSRTSYARLTDGGNEWGWTAYPTPGATNTTTVYASERLDPPVVSAGSQILKGTIKVQVDIPEGTTLMYSTDGSVPTSTNSGYQSKDGVFTISTTTNLVFRLFKDGYLPSIPVTRSFIKTDHNYTIPVISIVGNEKYFTDPVWGIDVKGTNGKTGNGSDERVNWNMDWDRPVNFSYIGTDGTMLFNQDVNISVSGGWTRQINPRSMKLKANKIFDGQNRFDFSFFPQKPYNRDKALLIRNGGNDVWHYTARFTDPALTTVIQRSGIDLDVQSFVQVAEYINGNFKGILNLRETSNDKYVYANFGYDDEEIDMFENKTFNNGTSAAYDRLCEIAGNSADAETYEEIRSLLDVDEFANYMAAELYLGNDDWPENNVKAYRSQNDGRYRFILFDLDFSFNRRDRNTFKQALDNQSSTRMVGLFINLLKNDEFRRLFIDAYCIMAGSVFEKDRAIAIIDELAATMRPMSQLDGHTPDRAANNIKTKLQNRLGMMMSRLVQYTPMKLSGVRQYSVNLSADTEGANLFINGHAVPYASFNGTLFAPVTLEAKAPAGYTFTGWKKSSGSSVQVIKTNETWKYYDKGEVQGSWTSTSFSDGAWSSGQAPLGYKFTDVKTTVSYGSDAQHKNPTTYFRKTFTLNGTPTSRDQFVLNYQVDDGFIIWVNGQEGGRVNMPQGTVGYNSYASTYADAIPDKGTLNLSPNLFKNGTNVIAVEVHNNQAASSDLFWDCELFTSVGASSGEKVVTDPVLQLSENESDLKFEACFKLLTTTERQDEGLTPVCINEVSAANGIYVNEYFERNDWIELYNTTDENIDVAGMYLSDNPDKPKKYQISGVSTSIPAHGYLVVWCDKLEPESQLHASFKLDADGGNVLLTAQDESWCNRLTYTMHKSDETVGRYPDGASNVITMNVPTIAKANISSSYAVTIEQPFDTGISDLTAEVGEKLTVSFITDRLVIHSPQADVLQINIVNLAGQSVSSDICNDGGTLSTIHYPLSHLPTGVYIANVTDSNGHKATCKFIKH